MEPLDDEVVGVPLSDLEIIRAALNSAYHHSTVLDLGDGYRKLHSQPQASNLTKSLQQSLTILISYIEIGQEETEDGSEASEE